MSSPLSTTPSIDFLQTIKQETGSASVIENNVNSTHFLVSTTTVTTTATNTENNSLLQGSLQPQPQPPSHPTETSQIPTQITQWLYIQAPPKLNMTAPTILNKNNIAVTVASLAPTMVTPLQISNLTTNLGNKNLQPLQTNQGVILAPMNANSVKPQHVFIQKPTGVQTVPVLPVSNVNVATAGKNTVTYFTMFKPGTPVAPAAAMNNTTPNQKFVIAPMPKITTNRLPATVTTNCVQPKIALMPVPLQNTFGKQATSKHKVFNLKIADGQIKSENNGTITVMCDTNNKQNETEQIARPQQLTIGQLQSTAANEQNTSDDFIDIGSLPTTPTVATLTTTAVTTITTTTTNTATTTPTNATLLEDKSYELSIVEDSNSRSEVNYTITIPDETETESTQTPVTKINTNNANKVQLQHPSFLNLNQNQSQARNDQYKFPKHGVSILKKNFNLEAFNKTTTSGSLIISPIIPNKNNSNNNNNIVTTSIADPNTKEVKISINSDSSSSSVIITTTTGTTNESKPSHKAGLPVLPISQKSEQQQQPRRRKSQFSYRKDYDEVIVTPSVNNNNNSSSCEKKRKIMVEDPVVTVTKSNGAPSCTSSPPPSRDDTVVEIKVIKEKPDINMNQDCFDAKKILAWEDGIGTLPGSDIKFHVNEFGILEYLQKDEYKQVLEKKLKPKSGSNNKKDEFQEEMRCLECGCYGMPSEFISPKYCSYDCEEAGNKAAKLREAKLKRKKSWIKKNSDLNLSGGDVNVNNSKSEKEEIPSEEDQSTSNENSQDKFGTYPWNCTKKGFSWAKYLEHVKAKAAPVKLFKDPFPYNRNGFRPGMKLEGVDPQHPSHFCVLTVAEVIGYRLRLHFDGFSENYDFWVNADSMDIFPAGWCEKYGHVLHPPPGYTSGDFNWTNYLKHTKSAVAPKHLFANRAGSAICPNGFRVGMKLEAVDRKNTSLVCVATVSDMMDNRILVHFDSWDDIYDYWADPTSPYIHPVGWCDQNGHSLTPPNDYPNPETFTWEKYLKETRSVAAPVRAFKQKPVYGFKKSMRLECVDKRVPQLIRAASVDDIREHQIRIKFDGWPDKYSYWIDNDSPNIHPVGWCQKTGHPIEPPLTPDDVYDFLECPTVGCRGQGHIKGPQLSVHSLPKDCPYADENMDRENILPDRLLSPDRQLEAVVPISREPRDKPKPKLGRPPKVQKRETPIKIEWNDDDDLDSPEDCKPLKRKSPKSSKSSVESAPIEKICKKEILPLTNGYSNPLTEQIWERHSRCLNEDVKTTSNPRDWEEDEVVKFVSSLPYCKNHGSLFKEHKIDGEAFLMLNQQDLVDVLNIKLGPAIKLYSIIMLLRRNYV